MALLIETYLDVVALLPMLVDAIIPISTISILTWLLSLSMDRVSIASYSAPLMILAAVIAFAQTTGVANPVNMMLMLMVGIWALRLSLFLIVRDRNQPEDRRYRMLRRRFAPHFALKSSYLVFLPMAIGTWLLSSLFALVLTASADNLSVVHWTYFHTVAVALWSAGLLIEVIADKQLYDFNRQVVRQQYTLDKGLWRLSRHPNYFGECVIWWSWFVFAIPSSSALILLAPMLVTWLLLRGTGIRLMERDISQRRPDYAAYQNSTSAFLPTPPAEVVNRGLYD